MIKDFIFPVNGADSLKIASISDYTEILEHDDSKIKISADSDQDIITPQYKISGDKIFIDLDERRSKILNFSFGRKSSKSFKIYIPKSILKLEFTDVSGDVLCSELTLKSLDLKTVSGDIFLSSSSIEDINIYSTSGDFKLDKTNFVSGIFKTTSGDGFIKNLIPLKRKTKMRTVSGDLSILYTCKPKAKISISSTSGDIKADFPVSYFKNSKILFTSEKTEEYIEMKSVSGDIILKTVNKEFSQMDEANYYLEESEAENSSSEINYEILDKETLKILQLFNSGKIDIEYARQMLDLIGYNGEEIEKMIDENKPENNDDTNLKDD